MALYEYWRDISPGSPFDTVTRYRFDDTDDSLHTDSFNVPSGNLGPVHPPAGTVILQKCIGLDFNEWKGTGSSASINHITTLNDPGCCTLSISVFTITKTNNTNLGTPNGTIKVVSAGVVDINDYQASIDGGATWVSPAAGSIDFTGLPGASYSVIIKASAGVCSVTGGITVTDVITSPPLIVSEDTKPAVFSPVFYPILISYELDNNDATVKQDMTGNYLEVSTDDAKDFLLTLPIIRILDSQYGGTYQVIGVDDPDTPTKFYISGLTYTTDRIVLFVPFERQVFYLYAETSFNVYKKIADLSVYPDAAGKYNLRLEGALQSVFSVIKPVNNGAEFTLLKKYYVVPKEFDMEEAPTIFNAVYSAIPDLTTYLGELTPLGPLPINFINQQTQYGLPVLFSYIGQAGGQDRVINVTSSNQTDIVSSSPVVYVPGLPLNQYDVTWINPGGPITNPISETPGLPAWITVSQPAADTIQLHIDLTQGFTGDYDPDDYAGDDYIVSGGVNSIVGCYSYLFKDGADAELFTLDICVFPIEKSTYSRCSGEPFNIAWVNRQGGWSSYIFDGRKVTGVEMGTVKTYKSKGILKRSGVEDLYTSVQVGYAALAKRDLDFIASMRSSIQAFLWSDLTQQWSIPIIINDDSFTSYADPFKQIDQSNSFIFRYAEEIRIQKQ